MTLNTINRLLAFLQDTMESEAWKDAVREAYQQWKYNKVHKDIKAYLITYNVSKNTKHPLYNFIRTSCKS